MPKKCGSLQSEARQNPHRPELCSLSYRPLSYLNAVSSDDNKHDIDPLTFQSRSKAYGMHDLAKRDRRDPTEENRSPLSIVPTALGSFKVESCIHLVS